LILLKGARNEFDAWDDGMIDGPMPAMATLEGLRSELRYVLLGKDEWKETPNYAAQVHRIFDSHLGGGTSMSYKLFALFGKGLGSARTALRSASHERALCVLVSLTKAMVDNDDWYCDTDAPEQAAKIVRELGTLWSSVLATAVSESRNLELLLAWLTSTRKQWEVDASDHLGVKMTFAFSAKPPITPTKAKSTKRAAEAELQPSPAKKPKSPMASTAASVDTEAWVHRLDAELSGRQASCVQLRCLDEVGGQQRILVVTGAYPLKAVGFTIAEAFGKAVDDFDPHPNKGKNPPGMAFALMREGRLQSLKATVKIVQAVQEPGDTMHVRMDGLAVTVTLDVIKRKVDEGFDWIKGRPMPRCVGGDRSLTPQLIRRLNRTFLHTRKPMDFLGCSKKQAITATIEEMTIPVALRQGEPIVERGELHKNGVLHHITL